jgi:formylglycine-generating enzyme required for sulfatase activity
VSTQLGECLTEPALEPTGWYCKNSDNHPHAVAQKQPNAYGVYDMHGNVGEWVNDLHDGLGYGQGPLIDPRGTKTPGQDLLPNPTEIEFRVVRGGWYVAPGDSSTAADRGSAGSQEAATAFGFRLVRTKAP